MRLHYKRVSPEKRRQLHGSGRRYVRFHVSAPGLLREYLETVVCEIRASLTDYGFVHAPAPSGFRARCYARYREGGGSALPRYFLNISMLSEGQMVDRSQLPVPFSMPWRSQVLEYQAACQAVLVHGLVTTSRVE